MGVNLQLLLNQECILGFVILIGFISRKTRLVPDGVFEASMPIIVNLLLPLFFATNISSAKGLPVNPFVILLFLLLLIILILIGNLVSKIAGKSGKEARMTVLISSCTNAGFLGIPLADALLGSFGTMYVGVYAAIDNLSTWSYHSMRLSSDSGKKKLDLKKIFSPSMIGIIVGFTMLFLGYYPKGNILWDTVTSLGSIPKWWCMMYIGSSISEFKGIEKSAVVASISIIVLRMMSLPIFMSLLLSVVFQMDAKLISVFALIAALPSITLMPVLALYYGTDRAYVTQVLIITTIFSFISIPLVMYIVNLICA